jgi:hypothetical protein
MTDVMRQEAPYPQDLADAVAELRYNEPPWLVTLADEARGQGCSGLTLRIYPDKPDSYHPENHVRTVFLYPVPAAAFNRESWEEWLWARIAETEDHERAENFKFVTVGGCPCGHSMDVHGPHTRITEALACFEPGCPAKSCAAWDIAEQARRPYKPAHTDGWDPGVVRTVVSESVANTPNAGRLVKVPCSQCSHHHGGGMGEHFTIEWVGTCNEDGCGCEWVVARV